MRRMPTHEQLLEGIKDVVADYGNAPPDIRAYTWLAAPKYWDALAVPGTGRLIEPRHEDRHGGVAFRVGWSEAERVVALWML